MLTKTLWRIVYLFMASLVAQMVKNLPAVRRYRFDPWVRKIPWRRAWQYTPVFLPGEFHEQMKLVGYIVHGVAKSWTRLSYFHFHCSFLVLSWTHAPIYFSIHACIVHKIIDLHSHLFWPPDAKNWLMGKDPNAGKDWRQEEKGMTEDEMVGWHHRLDGHEFEQAPGVGDGQGGLACWRP